MAQKTAAEATYQDATIGEVDASTYECDRRFKGEAIIKSDIARPVLVTRTWDIESDGTVHESTHYYAGNEPAHSAHLCDHINTEWSVGDTDNIKSELMENLTMDAQAEADSVLSTLSERVAKRKLGVGNQ